jgi:hypothetical protein
MGLREELRRRALLNTKYEIYFFQVDSKLANLLKINGIYTVEK